MISLKAVLAELEKGNPSSITVMKKNGELIELDNVVLAKFMNRKEKEKAKSERSHTKEVNTYQDGNRLFYIISSGEKREFKSRFITRFNGQKVHY